MVIEALIALGVITVVAVNMPSEIKAPQETKSITTSIDVNKAVKPKAKPKKKKAAKKVAPKRSRKTTAITRTCEERNCKI